MSTIKSSSEDLTLDADGGSSEIKLKINNVEKASISSAGAFTSTTIDATKLTGNLPAISGASLTSLPSHSGNVAFPATQVASADANTLDDYEEGTWTPTLLDGSGNEPTYITQWGHYIKIGHMCWCTMNIYQSAINSMSGAITIGGAPFTSVNLSGSQWAGPCGNAGSMAMTGTGNVHPSLSIQMTQNNSYFFPKIWVSTSGGATLTAAQLSDGAWINFSIQYQTA